MGDIPESIAAAAAALRDRTLSAIELTDAVLARADRHDTAVGVFLSRFDDQARAAAKQADEELAAGVDRGLLHGIPLGVKDIIATHEGPTTAQSLVMDDSWYAGRDAVVVDRLRGAGAVVVGKATTMEFAVGFPDPTKPFPTPRNPWDLRRWAGGSSSGTGNGVAAGCFLGGLGTDTGGSVRIPAALCGITGLKPTFGLVPKSGCVPLGDTLDHIGPMARAARDCALMLDVMAGGHPSDPCSIAQPARPTVDALVGHAQGLRIGVFRPHEGDGAMAHPAVGACFDAALEVLVDAGASLHDIDLPLYVELTDAAFLSFLIEAFTYHRAVLPRRWSDYGAATRLAFATGAMYSGADYFQAQRVRRAGAAAVGELFGTVDAIVLPTSMFPAPVLGAPRTVAAPFTSRPVVLPTPAFDALGIPALSVPMGFSDDVLPLGLQIVGRLGNDAGVLRIGDAFQRLTDWHGRIAPMHSSAPEADEAVAKATSVDEADRRAVTRIMDAAGLPVIEAEVDALAAGYPTIRAVTNALHRVTWDGDDALSKAVFAIDGMRGTDDGAR